MMVSELLVIEADRRVFLLGVPEHRDQVAEILDRHTVDILDDLGIRAVVTLADPVGEHRRADDDQLLALETRQVAPTGRQRAAAQ